MAGTALWPLPMKKSLLFATLLASAFSFSASAQGLVWARQLGSPDNDRSTAVTTDAAGNLYNTGNFNGTLDFDSGPGTSNLTAVGQADIFITKESPSGALLWAKSIGGANNDGSAAIALDGAGNVFICGTFAYPMDFDPGPGTFTLNPSNSDDVYICKLNNMGGFVWARRIGGSAADLGRAIATDGAGNVLVAGSFRSTVDFDPGSGTHTVSAVAVYDAFVLKLDAGGNYVWSWQAGGNGFDTGSALAVDASNNVYVGGAFQFTIDFDPGAGITTLASAGQQDGYVTKLDAAGNLVWARHIGGLQEEEVYALALDATGQVYASGTFTSASDFDPGSGTVTYTSAGGRDVFILKLDAAGNYLWARPVGGPLNDFATFLATDAAGHVYATGYFNGTTDFDPGAGTYNLTSAGVADAFILRLDAAGNFVYVIPMGGPDTDYVTGIALDGTGNVYATGTFNATADFQPGSGTNMLTSAGQDDIFIVKFDNTTTGVPAENQLAQTGIGVYPNPVRSTATLVLPAAPAGAVVQLYNSLGQLVHNLPVVPGEVLQLSRGTLPAGLYLACLTHEGRSLATARLLVAE